MAPPTLPVHVLPPWVFISSMFLTFGFYKRSSRQVYFFVCSLQIIQSNSLPQSINICKNALRNGFTLTLKRYKLCTPTSLDYGLKPPTGFSYTIDFSKDGSAFLFEIFPKRFACGNISQTQFLHLVPSGKNQAPMALLVFLSRLFVSTFILFVFGT